MSVVVVSTRSSFEMITAEYGSTQTMTVGLWYVDRFVRTSDGWRFAERSEELSYMSNLPKGFDGPS